MSEREETPAPCPACEGTGTTGEQCTVCFGSGEVIGVVCWLCKGRGKILCPVCQGTGTTEAPENGPPRPAQCPP